MGMGYLFGVMECSGIQAVVVQLCKCTKVTETYTLKDELYGVNYISIELLFKKNFFFNLKN